jgi:hypothetical protein
MIDEILKIPFVISNEDRQKYINDIEDLFAKDDWNKDVPYYQTWYTLFDRKERHWVQLKQNVLHILIALNPKLNIFVCWAYVSFVGKEGSLGDRWHRHVDKYNDRITCIIYLQTENENNGTMFDLGNKIIIPKVDINTIYVFNSNLLHTPTYWNFKKATKNRIVLSIDAWY